MFQTVLVGFSCKAEIKWSLLNCRHLRALTTTRSAAGSSGRRSASEIWSFEKPRRSTRTSRPVASFASHLDAPKRFSKRGRGRGVTLGQGKTQGTLFLPPLNVSIPPGFRCPLLEKSWSSTKWIKMQEPVKNGYVSDDRYRTLKGNRYTALFRKPLKALYFSERWYVTFTCERMWITQEVERWDWCELIIVEAGWVYVHRGSLFHLSIL